MGKRQFLLLTISLWLCTALLTGGLIYQTYVIKKVGIGIQIDVHNSLNELRNAVNNLQNNLP